MQLDFFLTLQKVLILFLLIVIGFVAGRTNLISAKGQKDITNLVLYITMPATIFNAMQLPLNQERVQTSLIIIGIMIFCYTVMFLVGLFVSRRLNLTLGQKDIFHTALLLSNTTFMGYPIVSNLLGEEALFYAVLGAGFIFEIVAWTLGIYLIGRNAKATTTFNWKKIVFSPGIISIAIGLLFFLTQWQLPTLLQDVVDTLSPATSPLAMIVVGLMLSRSDIQAAFKNPVLYLAAFLKLLAVPLLIVLILKTLGFSDLTLVIPVIMISMPSASYVAMFAGNAENDTNFASQIVFMTSLLSIITIPIVTLFL
ncbi:AEC family transporter [Aerococcaceae bacterium DSM 111020]|nr:AEC family transporter [Aerococcaceae bacterium DSM 111020]